MKLTDLNPRGAIGANCLYIEIGGLRIVIDAGIDPKEMGHSAIPCLKEIEPGSLDLIILTHCHLDHAAAIPVLMRNHPQAHLIMSKPSKILVRRILHNSVNVMKRQKAEHNITEYPFYTHAEVERFLKKAIDLPYKQERIFRTDNDSIALCLYPSGHIPGAVAVEIKHGKRRLFFTGDVLFQRQHILAGADFPEEKVDTLIVETTRGNTERTLEKSRANEIKRLIKTIYHTLERRGSVLIPTFALGRMQEIFAILHKEKCLGNLPKVPIYASGLGLDLADYFDEIARKTGGVQFRKSMLKDLRILPIHSIDPVTPPSTPAIYILSSGMLAEHTPAYHMSSAVMPDRKSSICFVGYCDPDTPGGKLLNSKKNETFTLDAIDFQCKIKADILKFDLSSHADREEILKYILVLSPRSIVLTHGDQEARNWFYDQLLDLLPNTQILDPEPLQTYTV